jgi:hypothetical protein
MKEKAQQMYHEVMEDIKELEKNKSMYKRQDEWCKMMYRLRVQQYLLEELLEINQ